MANSSAPASAYRASPVRGSDVIESTPSDPEATRKYPTTTRLSVAVGYWAPLQVAAMASPESGQASEGN
jgi:hypothetical protein